MAAQFNQMTGEWEEQESVMGVQSGPWDDPWGDASIKSAGNLHLGTQDGLGGNWSGKGQALNGGGYGTSYMQNAEGGNTYGVDSLETAQALAKQYGGTITKGYQGGEDNTYSGEGGGAGQENRGWGYLYTPPGEGGKGKSQREISDAIGFTKKESGLDALSDGQFAALAASLFFGAPLALGAMGAAGGLGVAEGVGAAGAAEGAGGLMGAEMVGPGAELAGGELVGPGAELASGEVGGYTGAGAGSNIGTSVSTGGGAGGGGVDALANSTVGNATSAATTAASKLAPSVLKALAGKLLAGAAQNPGGTSGNTSASGLGGSNSYFGATGPTNSAVAVGQSQQQQSPQQQQIAALLLQNPDQPHFNPLAYQDTSITKKLAQQLQEDDPYYG